MKDVAGSLRLDLSQFRELEAFSAFASDLDAASRAQLDRGARLVELLKQGQYAPVPVEEQVVEIFTATKGHLDDVPVADIRRFVADFKDSLRRNHADLLGGIIETKKFPEDAQKRVVAAVTEFKKQFTASDGTTIVNEAPEKAMDADKVAQESVKVHKPEPTKK
jgi:F-type H+-transporting ATPase subunit alpha